jgi:hypothetical protein
MSSIERDLVVGNLLDRIDELEARITTLERVIGAGLFNGTTLILPGGISMAELATQSLEIVDAGTTGATEQAWIEVEVSGGTTGYLRIFGAK